MCIDGNITNPSQPNLLDGLAISLKTEKANYILIPEGYIFLMKPKLVSNQKCEELLAVMKIYF